MTLSTNHHSAAANDLLAPAKRKFLQILLKLIIRLFDRIWFGKSLRKQGGKKKKNMAGAASALFLLDIKGRVLVWRDYRGDVTAAQAERFFTKLIETEVKF